MAAGNAVNANQTGIQTFTGTAFTGSTVTQHGVLVGGASNAVGSTAVGSTGQVLQAVTSSDPTYSTATFPSTATSTGTILRADGTNWSATTATYPATTTSQQLLYSSAANTVGGLATGNSLLAATNASGTLAMRAFSVVIQTFTATGTYTPTTGMLYCIIECVGCGGGSGGCAVTGATTIAASGGGGGGEYAMGVFSAATVGGSQSITIGTAGSAGTAGNNPGGTGGNTTVGSTLISAIGGAGGAGSAASATANQSAGGAGGTGGTGGSVRFPGNAGTWGFTLLNSPSLSGAGGGGRFSGNTISVALNTAATVGNGHGGGAGGGASTINAAALAGAAGTAGLVVVTEYVIA